jgi:predicted nuclease with TOPRIM domain
MTTIRDIADFVRIINEQPEWNDTIRGILLGRELLELPQRFAEFVRVTEENNRLLAERLGRLGSDVAQLQSGVTQIQTDTADMKDWRVETTQRLDLMEGRLDRMEGRLDQMEDRLDRMEGRLDQMEDRLDRMEGRLDQMEGRLDRMEGRLDQMEGRLGNIEGAELERRVHSDIVSIASRWLDINRARIVQSRIVARSPEFQDAIDDAEEQGLITADQGYHLGLTDVIISGRRRNNRQPVHVAIEVSRTIGDNDITRASERSQSLSAVQGSPAVSVVVGGIIGESQQELADGLGVFTIILPRLVV